MKKLLLILLFLFAPVFSSPQDAGLHLFGPQDKIVDFNMFNLVFGEFNCTKEEFKVTKGEKYTYYPQGKWISKQYLIENTEEFGEGEYSYIKSFANCWKMMKFIILIASFVSSPNIFACSDNYVDPDGKNVFFYEECLHMNRGKFTEKLHQKCKSYSTHQMIKHNMI